MESRRVSVGDAELEVDVRGAGEPVVLIQTALTADEFLPLARHPDLGDNYQVVLYHRRGYAGSSPVEGPGSIERDAADCRQLLAALGIERAHVMGVSYSAAVALQLAATSPECVHSLCVIEPPPVHILRADEFFAANRQLLEEHRRLGPALALGRFLGRIVGPDWRRDIEQHVPGGVAQTERDAETFFATDIPALMTWRFAAEDARRISQPVLCVGGTVSGAWFEEELQVVLGWLPQAEQILIPGADHSLALTHARDLAAATNAFLRRHPFVG
ncbi:alpha/beta hydrolase [Kribbella sp. NBC_01245]|uniref:alpha/beta fold hydrolase n=1 Tax=Kribbella sp. NBC_01245 TaxID=2903578 RepID=UPI002E289C32|nr:alpha/beta hydrolase [Kribbella sp. NBC_01245]